MSVKPALQLKIGQHLTMTPQLQQAIKLLQLSNLDLQAEVQKLLETNPLVEGQEQTSEISLDELKEKENHSNSEAEQEASLPERNWDQKIHPVSKGNYQEPFESQRAKALTLKDHLLWQMELTPFSPTDKQIAHIIIDGINDDGFLEISIEDIINLIVSDEVEQEEVIAVLHRIQQFDPIGVGARNLQECLLLQLAHLPATEPWIEKATLCVEKYIDILGKKDYLQLRRKLKVNEDELTEIIRTIQALNPRPGLELGHNQPDYVIPDAYVVKKRGQWVVELNPENLPKININQHYAQLIKRSDTSSQNQYLRDQLQEARWFLKSLQNRHETLQKVVEAIVEFQTDFFEHGEQGMKPMILHDVADHIDMHESTVSRVTTNKYLHTPRGTFELKYFFSSNLQNQQGQDCSSTAIRAMIKELIANEDKRKPLSDNKIANQLQEKGIEVARRTVAKYREAMKIPPSNERKSLV